MPEQEPSKLQKLSKLYERAQTFIAKVHAIDCTHCGPEAHGLRDVDDAVQELYKEAIKGLT